MTPKLRRDCAVECYANSQVKAGDMETLTILFFAVLIGIALAARMTAERVAREERSRVRIPVRVEEPEPRRDNLY